MSLNLITPPAYYPLTVDEAKEHLRVTTTDEDSYIQSLIVMATEFVQNQTGRQLITATYELTFTEMNLCNNWVKIPKGKLQSIDSIKYIDAVGAEQTFSTSNYYVVGNDCGSVYFLSFPPYKANTPDAVKIRFTCGYGNGEDIPEVLKVGMKLLIGQFYKNREATSLNTVVELPIGLDRLISQYSLIRLGAE